MHRLLEKIYVKIARGIDRPIHNPIDSHKHGRRVNKANAKLPASPSPASLPPATQDGVQLAYSPAFAAVACRATVTLSE